MTRSLGMLASRTILVLFLLLGAAAPAHAHPTDEANVYQLLWLEVDGKQLRIWDSVLVGELVAERVWGEMDGDHDRILSPAEQAACARSMAQGFRAWLDGRPLRVALKDYRFPTYDALRGRAMTEDLKAVQFHLRAPLPRLKRGPHTLRLENRTFAAYTCLFPDPVLRAAGRETSPPLPSADGRTTTFRFRSELRGKDSGRAPGANAGSRVVTGSSSAAGSSDPRPPVERPIPSDDGPGPAARRDAGFPLGPAVALLAVAALGGALAAVLFRQRVRKAS